MRKGKTRQMEMNDISLYRISPNCSKDEFLSASKVYARNVVSRYDLDVKVSDLDWEVSVRAKRRAGAVKRRGGEPTGISLTWKYFQKKGWKKTASTIRHELIHVHLINQVNDHGHGERFQSWAERLDTHVNCNRFCEPKWWVICKKCEIELPRYRKSKLIKNPDQYQCGNCGGEFTIRKSSGEESKDHH